MSSNRSYGQRDLKMLWARSGGSCAFPGCREPLSPLDSETLLGEIAHIVAVNPGGPRGDESYPPEKLNSYENLILLCPTDHRRVDDNPQYSVDLLKQWKKTHEEWVGRRLRAGEPWDSNISQPYYYNIPRLGILAAQHGFVIENPLLGQNKNLIEYGLELNAVLLGLESLLRDIEPRAIPLRSLSVFSSDLVGTILSFEGGFRTKGVPYPHNLNSFRMQGDPLKDPHLYRKSHSGRLIMSINPKWIATSTGFGDLTRGNMRCAGLCFVKRWNQASRDLVASPLLIGFPQPRHGIYF